MIEPKPHSPHWLLIAELIALYLIAPLAVTRYIPKRLLIPCIAVFGLFCLTRLLTDKTFDRRQLWKGSRIKPELPRIALFFALAFITFTTIVLIWFPDSFLSLIKSNPTLWAMIMVGYPIASVYPQELAFRTYFFHRYHALFGDRGLILASAAAFGFGHIVLENWFAMTATFAGGILFGITYARSRSTAATSLEHALYGCFMFTIGLGRYFYGGAWQN